MRVFICVPVCVPISIALSAVSRIKPLSCRIMGVLLWVLVGSITV